MIALRVPAVFLLLGLMTAAPARSEVFLVFPEATDTTWAQNGSGSVRQAFPPGVFGEAGWIPGSAVTVEMVDTPCDAQPEGPLFCGRVRLLASFVIYTTDPGGGCCGQGGLVVFRRGVPLLIQYDEAELGKTEQEDQIGLYEWDLDTYRWSKLDAEVDSASNVIRYVQQRPSPFYVVTVGVPPGRPTRVYTTWGGLLRLYD